MKYEPPTYHEVHAARDAGFAICPSCGLEHRNTGQQHLIRPWSITPLCIKCGEPLLMPHRRERAA